MAPETFYFGQPCLENDVVILKPFDPNIHVSQFVQSIKDYPQSFNLTQLPPSKTEAEFTDFYNTTFTKPENCLYAICYKDTSPDGQNSSSNYAGTIALAGTSKQDAATELGILLFPSFRKKHIATNAVGLMLLWLLDPPTAGGLGFRRVEWQANVENSSSRRLALRLEFELEGIKRWARVVTDCEVSVSADALAERNGTARELPGRHTAIYSIVWDEWSEKRPAVVSLVGELTTTI